MDQVRGKLSAFEDVTFSFQLATGDDFSTNAKSCIALDAAKTIYIQRIVIGISTADKAKSVTFQDTAGVILVKKNATADPTEVASTPGGVTVVDYGPDGFPLTQGLGLDFKNSATGIVMSVYIQAYRRRTTTVVGNTVNSSGMVNPQG